MRETELGKATWPEVSATTVLVPLGSTEQHGPHLPLDTDTRIAVAVAQTAAKASKTSAVVAPALAFGASGEHAGFAGTLSIGTEAVRTVIVELVRSAALSFERIVLVNGHGGNHAAVTAAADQMNAEGHAISAWGPGIPNGDAHAGRTETSLMLTIAPELVWLERARPGNIAPISELLDDLLACGVIGVSDNGVLGDPTGASAEEGAALLAALVADLVNEIDAHLA